MPRKASKKKKQPISIPEAFGALDPSFNKLDVAQKTSFIDMFSAGEISLEDVSAWAKELSDHSFAAKYLGSVPVAAAKLTDTMWGMFGSKVMADTALPRIKSMKLKPISVKVVITDSGVRVLNAATEEDIENEPLAQIVYSCSASKDKKKFAFFSHYSKLGLIYCHVFTAKDKDAQDMVSLIQHFVSQKPKDEVNEADRHLAATGGTLGIYEGRFAFERSKTKEKSNKEIVAVTADLMFNDLKTKKKKPEKDEDFKPDAVVIVISSEGVRVVDAFTREVLNTIIITRLTYVTKVENKKSEFFCVIYKTGQKKHRACHLFSVEQGQADEICATVLEACKVAKEDVKKREGNPFIPLSPHSESIKGPLAECQLPRRDLRPLKPLGAGQFGEVYLAEHAAEGSKAKHLRAVKMLRGVATAADKKEFLDEAEVMLNLSHKNIVELAGVCAQQRPWLVVLEFCSNGDLLGMLKALYSKSKSLDTGEQIRIAKDIAEGLAFVAEQRYVHLDVAARNCLVAKDGTIKVADFGLANKYDKGKSYFRLRKSLKLSIRWLAVECFRPPPKLLSEYSDVWSFGVTMWEIATNGRLPYGSYRLADVTNLVLEGYRMHRPSNCAQEVFDIISKCWAELPADRPRFKDIVKLLTRLHASFKATKNIMELVADDGDDPAETSDGNEEDLNEMANLEEYLKQYDYPIESLKL